MTTTNAINRKASYDPYGGPGCPLGAGGPSPLNLLYATTDTVQAAYALHQARQIGDGEGKRDASIRIFAAPATFFQAASSVALLSAEHIAAWSGWLLPLVAVIAVPVLVIGLGICVLELGFEGVHVKRALTLLNNLHVSQIERLTNILSIPDEKKRAQAVGDWIRDNALDPKQWAQELELLSRARREGALLQDVEPILASIRDKLVRDDLQYLHAKYLTLDEKDQAKIDAIFARGTTKTHEQLEEELLAVKRAKLVRRVMPWCANEVQANVPSYLQRINTSQGGARSQVSIEATKLLAQVATQAKKKLLIHTLGMIGIVLTILALGFHLAPVLLLLIAGILITLAYMYAQGTLGEKNWGFSFRKAILPNCVINWLENRKKKTEAPLPIQPARVAVI